MLALLALACVPVLESPSSDSGDAKTGECGTWEPPTNIWGAESPPDCLSGEGYHTGDIHPDIRMVDQNGEEVSMWQFYGNVIVIDFSTMWCAPCAELATHVDETWKDYEDDGFMYLTVLSQDHLSQVPDVEELNEWADEYRISAPVLQDGVGYTDDVIPPPQNFPQIMIVGRDMRILDDSIEPAEDPSIRAAVEAAL